MVHDLVCSWCPIGYNNIKQAINNLNIAADFYFLPFELNPNMGEKGELVASYFHRQFNWSEDKLLAYQKSLITTADIAGINIDFSKRKYYYNTYKGHLLMHWSERFNKHVELNESLIYAYFEQGLDISNRRVLLDIAEQVGLDRELACHAIDSEELKQELAVKITEQHILNLNSVPAFILNSETVITGSQSVEYFEDILRVMVNESVSALSPP